MKRKEDKKKRRMKKGSKGAKWAEEVDRNSMEKEEE